MSKKQCPLCGEEADRWGRVVYSKTPTATLRVCHSCQKAVTNLSRRMEIDDVVEALLEIGGNQ